MLKRTQMVWALSIAFGCAGTESGNPFAGDEAGDPSCQVVGATSIEMTETTALGFSARDVLAFSAGTHDQPLRWQPLRVGTYEPQLGTETLLLEITARTARVVEYANKSGDDIDQGCGQQLEIDADVKLRSSGRVLDENTRGTLVATGAQAALLKLRLDPARLDGSLTVTPPDDTGVRWTTRSIDVRALFTPYGLNGTVTPSFEQQDEDSAMLSAGAGPMATIGRPACEGGFEVPLDSVAVDSMLSRLRQHRAAMVDSEAASVVFEPEQSACQLISESSPQAAPPTFRIPGELQIKTVEGLVDAQWPVHVTGSADTRGQTTGVLALELSGSNLPSRESLANRYGLFTVEAGTYTATSVEVLLSLAETGWSGSIVAWGYASPACSDAPEDAGVRPGCGTADRAELGRLQVH
jgi:hypothetical protein